MEVICYSETSADFQITTCRYVSECGNRPSYCCYLKFSFSILNTFIFLNLVFSGSSKNCTTFRPVSLCVSERVRRLDGVQCLHLHGLTARHTRMIWSQRLASSMHISFSAYSSAREVWDERFLRNVCYLSPDCTELQPRRQETSC
jgi:hypothetical protein